MAAPPGVPGKALLSWRVALLPYLDQDSLYKQFRLDQPWDSPHNKALLAKMPAVYAPPGADPGEAGLTWYQGIVGQDAGFERGRGLRGPNDFPDGTSNTLVVVEAGAPVPWTKPEDLPYVADQAPPRLGGLFGGDFHALTFDGAVHLISRKVSDDTLRALIGRSDGQVIDWAKVKTLPLGPALGGGVTAEDATRANARLHEVIRTVKKEAEQAREELKLLKARLEFAAPGLDLKTLGVLEENAKLQEALAKALGELEELKEQRARLRGEL